MSKKDGSLIVFSKEEVSKMLGDLPFTETQLNMLMAPTPKKFIRNRPIAGGGTADFVSGHYVMNLLNYVTAFQWDFEVLEEKIKFGQIIVLGKLTLTGKNGKSVVKTQYGRASIKYPKGRNYRDENADPVDYGNDFKAAATDALKKCASLAGVAWDVYGNEDIAQLKVVDTPAAPEPPKPQMPIEDVKFIVDAKLATLSSPDKLRFLKTHVNALNDKSLTEDQYRKLYDNLPRDRKEANEES